MSAIKHATQQSDITRLASALEDALGAVDSLSTQVEQMKGMFDDSDGAIAAALEDGEAVADAVRALLASLPGEGSKSHSPNAEPTSAPRVGIRIEGGVIQAVFADQPVQVDVIDYDVEDREPDQMLCNLEQDGGRIVECLLCRWDADVLPHWFPRIDSACEAAEAFESGPSISPEMTIPTVAMLPGCIEQLDIERTKHRIVVVCPKHLMRFWGAVAEKNGFCADDVCVLVAGTEVDRDATWFVVNYESLGKHSQALEETGIAVVVLDEASGGRATASGVNLCLGEDLLVIDARQKVKSAPGVPGADDDVVLTEFPTGGGYRDRIASEFREALERGGIRGELGAVVAQHVIGPKL